MRREIGKCNVTFRYFGCIIFERWMNVVEVDVALLSKTSR